MHPNRKRLHGRHTDTASFLRFIMQHTNIKKEATCLSMIKEVDEGGRSDSPRNNRQVSLNTNGYRQLHATIFALSSCTYAYTYPCMRLQSMDLYTHHLNQASHKTLSIRIILLVIDSKKKRTDSNTRRTKNSCRYSYHHVASFCLQNHNQSCDE